MNKNVYFHIDELGRDAITASALKRAFQQHNINLVYGNRAYTKRLLERFASAFDLIILPRPMFLNDFKNLNKKLPPIMILFTESVGRVVDKNNDKFTLFSIFDAPFMEGDSKYIDKITSFFLWGVSSKKRVDKYFPKIANKFHVIGHPRHDKRCLEQKHQNVAKANVKIGLITRQPLLNDFLKRRPVEAIVSSSSSLDIAYDYYNKITGDYLLSQDNHPVDEVYMEASDINTMLQLLLKLNKEGHEIHLKVHPREDRDLWKDFVKKYNLNVILANWRMPFSKWAVDLDFVIGPSSTSFYDCCVMGTHPICTRKIDNKRDMHLNKFSEEFGDLMQYIDTPDSIDEIIEIISRQKNTFHLSEGIKEVLYNETNYPNSKNSLNNLVKICINHQNIFKINPIKKYFFLIGFNIFGFILNMVLVMYRFFKRTSEQGSTFLLSKNNRSYIDSLVE